MSTWKRKPAGATFEPEEVLARLAAELPKWTFEDGWIRRKYRTAGWKGTLMVVNTVGHLAEAAWHHPDLTVSYAFVNVKLMTHDAKGITEKDFALAKKIEEVLMWRPEPETTLEGTPDDARFKYLKYD
jgi:4a-hydroxytetrahydrobiopterin dehydratase